MAAAKIAGLEGELQSLQAASEEVQQSLRSQLSATQVELETLKVVNETTLKALNETRWVVQILKTKQ